MGNSDERKPNLCPHRSVHLRFAIRPSRGWVPSGSRQHVVNMLRSAPRALPTQVYGFFSPAQLMPVFPSSIVASS